MLGMWEWLKWLGVGESPRLSYFVWSADLTAAKESLQRIARAWFLSSNRDPGSFLWVCDRLDLEPTAVRHRVYSGGHF